MNIPEKSVIILNMDNVYTPLDNKTIKLQARTYIRGRLWQFWSLLLVISLIEMAANYIPELIFGRSINEIGAILTGAAENIPKEISYSSFAWYYVLNIVLTLLLMPLNVGFSQNTLLWTRGVDEDKWKVLFSGFTSAKAFFKTIGTVLLYTILCSLWAILLVVPGIIKGIAYSMYPYILRDEPELSVWQTLKKSDEIMKGYKGRFFTLMLSFIGWIILGAFTFGILYVWLVPYMQMSAVKFYDEVRRSYYNGADPARPVVNEETPSDENESDDVTL